MKVVSDCFLRRKVVTNYFKERIGSITYLEYNKKHPDYIEMQKVRVVDLIKWGYEDFALKIAFNVMIRYGFYFSDKEFFLGVIDRMNGKIPNTFSRKRKIMLKIYKFSPKLFDIICIITGKRVR